MTGKGAKKTGASKSKVAEKAEKAEPEIIILERTEPKVKKLKAAETEEAIEAEVASGAKPEVEIPEATEGIEEEPNKPERNRTKVPRGAVWGILIAVIVGVMGLATWRVMSWQNQGGEEIAQEQEPAEEPEELDAEMTEEEKAAEAERKRQEELAEQERQRQEALEKERKQREEQMAQVATSGRPLVALTFDDGPSGATTPRLLDILKEKNVKATFFVLGGPLGSRPDIAQRAEAEGHEVESHTMTHRNLERATVGEIQWEVASMNQLFQEKLGHLPSLTRPPYGNGIRRAEVTGNVGMPMIYWSVDTEDWRSRNAAAVQERIRKDTYDGAIILMHDIYASTVDAVAGAIDELRARGYEFVTVKEMARLRGVTMMNGVTYFNFRP